MVIITIALLVTLILVLIAVGYGALMLVNRTMSMVQEAHQQGAEVVKGMAQEASRVAAEMARVAAEASRPQTIHVPEDEPQMDPEAFWERWGLEADHTDPTDQLNPDPLAMTTANHQRAVSVPPGYSINTSNGNSVLPPLPDMSAEYHDGP